MVIVHWTQGGAYILAELNGTISRLQYAVFWIIPYLARFPDSIPVTTPMDEAEMEDVQIHWRAFPWLMNHPRMWLLMNKFLLKSPSCPYPPLPLVINIFIHLTRIIPSSEFLPAQHFSHGLSCLFFFMIMVLVSEGSKKKKKKRKLYWFQ